MCKNIAQCQDPASFAAPVIDPLPLQCKVSYPCNCAALNGSQGSLACQCQNPSSGLSAPSTINANQCMCKNIFNATNKTWSQSCQCCLADDFVRANLLAPVTCPAQSLKEQCLCTNQTVSNSSALTSLSCDCLHPAS